MHPTRIDLLLLLSLSLITELLSHTSLPLVCFCFSFCVSDALSRDTSRSSCASPRCQSFFGFVILSSFFLGLQLCRYAHALSCSSFLLPTNSLSSHSVSVVNIDFFFLFFPLPSCARYLHSLSSNNNGRGRHTTRDLAGFYEVGSCWNLSWFTARSRGPLSLMHFLLRNTRGPQVSMDCTLDARENLM